MSYYLRVWSLAAAILIVAGVGFGLGQESRSSLLTPQSPFEKVGMGEWQGTQVFNKATGRIESLFGMKVGPFQGPAESAALQYLATQASVTGYAPNELSLLRSIESQGSHFVTFEAKVGGLPVYPGETVVTFDREMHVVFLFNGLLPVARNVNTKMALSEETAIQIARDFLKPSGTDQGGPFTREVLWVGDEPARPAWMVTIPAEQPRGDWQIFVDGNSGEIFRVRNNEKDFNGHGMAFVPDPITTGMAVYGQTGYTDNSDANSTQLQAQRVAVTLPNITFSGGVYSLVGPWVNELNFENPAGNPVTSADSNGFSFTRDAQGFEDVMCYYHIDLSQRWIQSLGFNNIQHAAIGCDPHGLSGADNSHYIPSTNRIAFGEGGVDDAEDADVIWHEYGHGIQNSEVPNWGAGGDEGAMGEGFGDYWAGSYSASISSYGNTWIFNWDGHNEWWAGRTFTQNKVYPTNLDGEVHDDGEIWSQACYDTRNRANMGRTAMDKVVLQHHFSLGTSATMPTAAAAILTADNTLYGGVHYPDIYAGYVPRGLLSSSGAIACIAPNGGESWTAGTNQTISWSYYNLTGNVRIELNRTYPSGTWEMINNTTALSAGSYSWTVSGSGSTTARIRVSADNNTAINDLSNANFSIVSSGPSLTVTAPNGGETWIIGDANNITWASSNLSENVKIELNRAYPGTTWETIIASTANSGTYAWTVSGPTTAAARVRITGVTSTTVGDTSNGNFAIGVRTLVVSAPNGGETWLNTDVNTIMWTSSNLSENVKIELNRAYPGTTWETIIASTANTGTYAWTVSGAATITARVRITGVTHTTLGDSSDANFAIAPRSITVTAPNGGETWYTGATNAITWTSANLSENVKIELNRAYPGTTWETIIANTANSGSYNWTTTTPTTSAARVRITGVTHTTVGDSSNANFAIATRALLLTVPNGGELWLTGDNDTIRWTSSGLSENVKLELNRSYPGTTWETLVASTANSGSYVWAVTSPTTTTARVRITGTVQTTVGDSSNANFTIASRSVTVTAPNGAENWAIGTLQNIVWTSANLTGNVAIDLNRNYPAGAWESIAASTTNIGLYGWTVTAPITNNARVRVTAVSYPTVSDVSDAAFTIYAINQPPVIAHDPLHDQNPAPFAVTAIITDDAPGFAATFFYRAVGAGSFTSLPMSFTGNSGEYAVTVGALAEGQYEYYLSVTDAGNLTVATAHYFFFVAANCGSEIAYDDGTAERSNWSQNTGMKWAVKFDAPTLPYLLCNVRVGISANHPDLAHSPIQVSVALADGPGGMPGTTVVTRVAGSIGNVIGGVPLSPDNWTTVVFRNNGQPFILNSAFYVVVSNPDSAAGYESFLSDSSSALAGRSYVYSPCDSSWHAEVVNDSVAWRGNLMIRVSGFGMIPPNDVVASPVGNDIRLDWTAVGAPYYHIYSSLVSGGPYTTLVGTATTNTFTDVGVTDLRKFYLVLASTTP